MSKPFKQLLLAGAILILGAGWFRSAKAQADAPQNVAPYEFGSVPVPFHLQDVKLYKAVHQGCEIFIATNGTVSGKEAASVAIATGRGCK